MNRDKKGHPTVPCKISILFRFPSGIEVMFVKTFSYADWNAARRAFNRAQSKLRGQGAEILEGEVEVLR